MLDKSSASFFCTWISSFLSTVSWKDCSFTHQWSWHHYRKSSDHIHEDLFLGSLFYSIGLPWWLSWWRVCLQCGRPRFNPWVRKIPWRRKWQPISVFLPGEFHGQKAWWATVQGVTKSQTWLSDCLFTLILLHGFICLVYASSTLFWLF